MNIVNDINKVNEVDEIDDIDIYQMIDMIELQKQELDMIYYYYEPIYQCLCSQYSVAYLKGSEFYVGSKLHRWWNKLEPTSKKFRQKMIKWHKIKEILDNFMTKKTD